MQRKFKEPLEMEILYDTNFKALFEIDKIGIKSKVVAFAEHSGRLDQIFGIFETLFHVQGTPVFVVSSTSIEWLLIPGKHFINIPQ